MLLHFQKKNKANLCLRECDSIFVTIKKIRDRIVNL